ncbi:response regulator [Winogradskyella sp.]|jgi:CheY-like chemotaxis protein|uniref:response regulator n=1 Tax=Winogradskyella sp. TaxID=1883156 RepID=UPI0025EC49B6|nr:response regulator [Winogradskyella sp.]MCT4628903.1 response regulator [Winogradskyella sp.]
MTKVLLIEDDTILRENTAELLEILNFEVITAPNGKLGLKSIHSNLPDIIVCDIMMPELDGYEVLKEVSKSNNTKHIPFIFLSAKTEHKDVRKGMNLGADDYITKPFTEDELVSAIKSRLAKASILKDQGQQVNVNNYSEKDELTSINDLKNFFDDYGKEYHFNKDQIIYREGDHANYIYLIKKGVVKCHKLDDKGKELATSLYKEDNLFGYTSFTHNLPHKETATAIQETELAGLSILQLSEILDKNNKVAVALIDHLTDDLSEVKEQLLQMAYSSVNKKTANTILQFAERINQKPNDPIKISRNDLASVAGVATETLIRTLTSFKNKGLIISEGRNIVIKDIEGLKQMQ